MTTPSQTRAGAGTGGAAIVAWGAISARGEAELAASAGEVGAPARSAVAHDAELARAGLTRPFAARASLDEAALAGDDRATELLARALAGCADALDAARPGWRLGRVGLAIGTSSGGMRAAERMWRGEPVEPRSATYFGPLAAVLERAELTASPASLVLGACVSGSLALGLALRWLEADACDLVLAGGFDAVSVFVASGFEAMRATTASPPLRPFRGGRDGLALGEGAAVLALVRASSLAREAAPRARVLAYIAGFGASCDATHVTAPDRTGGGLARAARAALADAGALASAIDLVSPHATATPYNDAAEAKALAAVLGSETAARVPMTALKAELGHTLGAAGALEALQAAHALARGVLPASVGGALGPRGARDARDEPARLLDVATAAPLGAALKLASAFGGANAALVLTRDPPTARPPRPRRAVYVASALRVTAPAADLAARFPAATLARADGLLRLGLTALARLEAKVGSLTGAGLLAGHALATLETNTLYAAGLLARGAHAGEPRRFPYTSPNAVCGECAVAFGLTGPCFATGGGPHGALEALAVAADLVAAGDAARMVVLAVDEVGPATARMGELARGLSSGAVALLLTADEAGALFRVEGARVVLGPSAPSATSPTGQAPLVGHAALAPLADLSEGAGPRAPGLPICLSSSSRGSFAEVRLMGVNG